MVYVIQVCWQLASRIRTERNQFCPVPARKLSANLYVLLCVQWKTSVDGQRNCPKHVEFYSKNKFEKLVHIVGFIIRILKCLLKQFFRMPNSTCSLLHGSISLKSLKIPLTIFSNFTINMMFTRFLSQVLSPDREKTTIIFVPSVCVSPWNNSAPTGRIIMHFDIWIFF